MGLSTHFIGEIRNVCISEFAECLTALTGHCYFLQNEAGDLFAMKKLIFKEISEPQNEYGVCVLPYGEYRLTRALPVDSFRVRIEKDRAENPDLLDGLRISIFSFIDKPYQDGDFALFKDLCRHLGYSSYQITSEYGGEPVSESFGRMSSEYFRNIRGCKVDRVALVVDRLIADHPENGKKERPDVEEVYRRLAEKRNEEAAKNGAKWWETTPVDETAFLYDRAVVNGYYECGLSLEEYKEELKSVMPDDFERNRIDRIFDEFDTASTEFENFDKSPEM